MRKKKILFLIGSLNQTRQMHKISMELPGYECFFSQLYSNHPLIKRAIHHGILDTTILGGEFKRAADAYLLEHNLKNDYAASAYDNTYDLAVLCSDLLVPRDLRKIKTVFVQEGMTDPITRFAKITRKLGLPAYMAMGTAFNGTNNLCDIYCVASAGYREQFASLGTERERILVTGIPNYDHITSFARRPFPHKHFVLVATSDIRETFRNDNRVAFIRDCIRIASGRPLIFKLHPNENKDRAEAEIRKLAPFGTLVFRDGSAEDMVANCDELITQYSTLVYVGLALGKKVHSYFDVEKLKQLMPLQNNGHSAANIADICRGYLEYTGSKKDFLRYYRNHHQQQCA